MSEVKRYHRSINLEGITKVYEVVLASDYDIALSQLAALREELDINKSVVLPPYMPGDTEDSDVLTDCRNEGWNACLDKVKELNQ